MKKNMKIAVLCLLFAISSVANGATFPEGQCEDSQIMTQNLKAPRSGTAYVKNGHYHWYTKAIVSEADVLQRHLNRLGFNAGKVDGIIGPNTKGAILRMQKFLGTKQDGYVGPKTRKLLNNSCGSDFVDADENQEKITYTIIKEGKGKKITNQKEVLVKTTNWESRAFVNNLKTLTGDVIFQMKEGSSYQFTHWDLKRDFSGKIIKKRKLLIIDVNLIRILENDAAEYEEVLGHEKAGKEYITPWFAIYTDNFRKGGWIYSKVGGTTNLIHFPRTKSSYNVYENIGHYQDMEPKIGYLMPGSKIIIKKVFNKPGKDYNIYLLEDENGIQSHMLDFSFDDQIKEINADNQNGDQLLTNAKKNKEKYFTIELDRRDIFNGSQTWYGTAKNIWNNPYTTKEEKGKLTVKEFEKILYKKYKKKVLEVNNDYSVVKVKLAFDELLFFTLFDSDNLIQKIHIYSEKNITNVSEEVSKKESEWIKRYGKQDLWWKENEIEKLVTTEKPFYFDENKYVKVKEKFFKNRKSWDMENDDVKNHANLLNTAIKSYNCKITENDLKGRIEIMKKLSDCIPGEYKNVKDGVWELKNKIEEKYRWTKHQKGLYPFYGMCNNFCKE